jgi:hypothetical protein
VFWWKEALIVAVFYVIYSWTRNQFGSNRIAADGVPEQAFNNAERVIRFQRFIGLYHEETVQEIFLPYEWFIQFWNVYYGTAHFFVTLGVFILLYVKRADVFPQWRNTLAAMTALAIIGFAFFPLMPPRLLDAPCPQPDTTFYGGACVDSELRPGPFDGTNGFGFVDTLSEFGGPWKFDSETVASVSNQYAAMPSMHIGWATWCAIAVWPLLRRRWVKIGVLLYPAATLFCIVVTGNHFWIDGVGGLAAFGFGALIGLGLHRWNQNRLDRLHGPVQGPAPTATAEELHGSATPAHGIVDQVSPPTSTVDVSSNVDEPDAVEPPQRSVGHDRPRPGEPTE